MFVAQGVNPGAENLPHTIPSPARAATAARAGEGEEKGTSSLPGLTPCATNMPSLRD